MTDRRCAALIVAAGRGTRAGDGPPKQYRALWGEPLLTHSARALSRHPGIAAVQIVWNSQDKALYAQAIAGLSSILEPVDGGDTRQASVLAGLEALANLQPAPTHVLVHDAARPFVSHALIDRALAALGRMAAAIPVIAVTDTIKAIGDGQVTATLRRDELAAAQTPQAFAFQPLLEAHRRAAREGWTLMTDDAALMERAGHAVGVFAGEESNIKMTTPEDFARFAPAQPRRLRIGQGYDVHAFGPGDHVMLGGVRIAHTRGITAHSDGDVLLHALTDALLGAIAMGDIGQHFPPSDPRWRQAASSQFVSHARALLEERGGVIENVDLSLIAEAPRIGPHRSAIIEHVAALLGLPPDCVGLKATTNEAMGFIGRGEGLAAMASVLVSLPAGAA